MVEYRQLRKDGGFRVHGWQIPHGTGGIGASSSQHSLGLGVICTSILVHKDWGTKHQKDASLPLAHRWEFHSGTEKDCMDRG
jgi:hypothetical protein